MASIELSLDALSMIKTL